MKLKYSPYSYSKLACHGGCPRQFKYAYITKPEKGFSDRTALIKGGAVHNIFEKYPEASTHKAAKKYQEIADKFIVSDLGKKYFFIGEESKREFKFGLSKKFDCTSYNDKNALFRGKIDHICIIDEYVEEIIEVDSIDDIPSDYEILEIIDE